METKHVPPLMGCTCNETMRLRRMVVVGLGDVRAVVWFVLFIYLITAFIQNQMTQLSIDTAKPTSSINQWKRELCYPV